ncbi:MAG: HAMP domain-containing histidine kinase [Flavobacteriales bacterium]|nr:HAMP domain-containing histidine kinase [Flavobacteriales bacterium]
MSLYSRKQKWKIFLMILALVIIGLSLWYSNFIVDRVRDEERQKVELWSQAIEKRATLVAYTKKLFAELADNEQKKVSLWSEAMRVITNEELDDYTFITRVIQDNTTIPMIVVDEQENIIFKRNIEGNDSDQRLLRQELEAMKSSYPPLEVNIVEGEVQYLYYKDSRLFSELRTVLNDLITSFISETVINSASVPVLLTNAERDTVLRAGNVDSARISTTEGLERVIQEMSAVNDPLRIELGEGEVNYIFYEDSVILKQLRYFPFVQFLVIGLFLLIAYILFSTFRKAEQNQVWVGMAKETAHQLGTPLSSLMAWMDLLRAKGVDEETIHEMNKDVSRLETITDRFSKIGSRPELDEMDLNEVLDDMLDYLRPRFSSKVEVILQPSEDQALAHINRPLFGWVIENLCKNAVDAMDGEGELILTVTTEMQHVYVDVTDTGKGIPAKFHKTIFQPGYTTKKRGWGLGLSLTKRIIENYHRGKVFVKRSEVDQGTTFRIVLDR